MPLAWLAAIWLALIALFAPDWAAMADQWWNSSTYNHVLLVPAIIAWLVWQRAPQLARLTPSTWWPALIVAAGGVLVWVLGAFAGLNIARQLGVVVLMIGAAIAVLGPRVSAALAFPLAYMLLLVPFGDELVPPLQMITADITIALVHLSGVAAHIDGVFIDTPAGLFEVAEACSGVKFLIAMIAFGLLVANVCFKSWTRRVLFMAVCLIVPILANGVRAWGTIYVAQFVGAEAASGFDHIIYGWIFFGIVIALVLVLSWRFFDRDVDDPAVDVEPIERSVLMGRLERLRIAPWLAAVVLGASVLAGQGWAYAADQLRASLPARIALPEVPGWHHADYRPAVWWEPRAHGADHRLLGRYVDDEGRVVDVSFALYAAQEDGAEAGGYGQGALTPQSAWAWQSPIASLEGGKGDRLLANGSVMRVAMTWYRTGDLTTGSNTRLKLANILDRLLLRERPTMALILSSEVRADAPPAEQSLAAFRRSSGPLDAWMDRVAGIR